MITIGNSRLHWNYYVALERDLENVTRYIEFCDSNLKVYSIELAHLLFAAASEVDVIAKLLCSRAQPSSQPHNIKDYSDILAIEFPDLPTTKVFLPRYAMHFCPWDNWGQTGRPSPHWWKSYNNVKHNRDAYFPEATLQHALNALGALLILTSHYYRFELAAPGSPALSLDDATGKLDPPSMLLRLDQSRPYGVSIGTF